MKKLIGFTTLVSIALIFNNCASIVSTSMYPVRLNSTPDNATVTITNNRGVEVFKSTTPATAQIKASVGYFQKAIYTVEFSKQGYQTKTYPITATIDGWYWGNLFLGGLLGMLIIDPATGAMFKIDTEYIDGILSETTGKLDSPQLHVYDYQNIPIAWKEHVVKITQ